MYASVMMCSYDHGTIVYPIIDTLTLQGLEMALKPMTIRVMPDVTSSLYFPDTSEYYNKYGPRIIKPCI